jgi:hypothetical protein
MPLPPPRWVLVPWFFVFLGGFHRTFARTYWDFGQGHGPPALLPDVGHEPDQVGFQVDLSRQVEPLVRDGDAVGGVGQAEVVVRGRVDFQGGQGVELVFGEVVGLVPQQVVEALVLQEDEYLLNVLPNILQQPGCWQETDQVQAADPVPVQKINPPDRRKKVG